MAIIFISRSLHQNWYLVQCLSAFMSRKANTRSVLRKENNSSCSSTLRIQIILKPHVMYQFLWNVYTILSPGVFDSIAKGHRSEWSTNHPIWVHLEPLITNLVQDQRQTRNDILLATYIGLRKPGIFSHHQHNFNTVKLNCTWIFKRYAT